MLEISIHYGSQVRQIEHEHGPIEFGREAPTDGAVSVILADPSVSRRQLRAESIAADRLRLHNVSKRVQVTLYDGRVIKPETSLEVVTPAQVKTGDTVLDFVQVATDLPQNDPTHTMMPQRSLMARGPVTSSLLSSLGEAPSSERFAQWMVSILGVQKSAVGSDKFFLETAEAMVEIVGLDRGLVLRRRLTPGDDADWELRAAFPPDERHALRWSMTVLREMVANQRGVCRSIDRSDVTTSLAGVEAVVVSPLFDAEKQIVGALYGLRASQMGRTRPKITPLEAQAVELLAAAVDAGVARQKAQEEFIKSRLQFETFFGETLAKELLKNPKMLDGVNREITTIFCDVRDFSKLSESLKDTPALICGIINTCMEAFTEVVLAHEGVVVDYVGDGLLAMWNAPREQPNHAALACAAARDAINRLPRLNEALEREFGRKVDVAIGVNTGPAQIGNIGSKRRMKYGPLGHSVNVASRIQGTTRYLGIRIALSEATFRQLPKSDVRILGKAQVVGMRDPLVLYQYGDGVAATTAWQSYVAAWQAFEQGDLSGCLKCLDAASPPAASSSGAAADGPSEFLRGLATKYLAAGITDYPRMLVFDKK